MGKTGALLHLDQEERRDSQFLRRPKILIVDDDSASLRLMGRLAGNEGWERLLFTTASGALESLEKTPVDAVVTDILMPGMNGLDFLKEIRKRDLDVPVIFVTGAPSLETALRAMDDGVLGYIRKPFDQREFSEALRKALRAGRLAAIRRRAIETLGLSEGVVADLAGTAALFDTTLEGLRIHYQPLIGARDGRVVAYEALMRPVNPVLSRPGLVLAAAEQLDRVFDLGRIIRAIVSRDMQKHPDGIVFLNLHPTDLLDPELTAGESALSAMAERTVLEVTERSELDPSPRLEEQLAGLRELGFRLALDDLGSGYASLRSFLTLQPDFVKIDVGIVRGVAASPTQQRLIRSIIDLCHDDGIAVVAEGIENDADREMIVSLGCDLLQGFLLGKPAPWPDS